MFTDGELAFARMREAIDAAREEVLLETYILRDDQVGMSMRRALLAAAARGVRVCVLADAIGSMATARRYWRSLENGGVTVRLFQRVWHHPLDALRRDHRKLLVIDRELGFTGGMNIGEEYGSSINRRRTVEESGWRDAWRDTFIALTGTVVLELAAVFAEGWDRANGPDLPGLEYVSWAAGTTRPPGGWKGTLADRALQPLKSIQSLQSVRSLQSFWNRQMGRHNDRARGRRVRRPTSQVDTHVPAAVVIDPRPGRAQRESLTVLALLAGAATRRLWITTPYFAPPSRALRLLATTAARGVDVRLLLPGESSDVPLARHAGHGAFHFLLSNGIRIYEYQRANLHAKTLVVDSHAGMVGSSNMDFRSFWLNAECNVLVMDDAFGRALDESFMEDVSGSTEVQLDSWRRRPLLHKAIDRTARSMRWAL